MISNTNCVCAGPGIARWQIVEKGALKIGITGITTAGATFIETPGFEVTEPVRAGRAALKELEPQVDLVILLSYAKPEAARRLAETGLVDIVIDTNLHRERYEPLDVGGAVWVRSHFQTMRLGELRIGLDDTGAVEWALDRKVDLDKKIPDDPSHAAIADAAREDIDAAQKALFGARRR